MVIPREENLATSSSKFIPPTPITSIMSAGLFRVLRERGGEREREERGEGGRERERGGGEREGGREGVGE